MPTVPPQAVPIVVALVAGVVATLMFRRAGTALSAAFGRGQSPERSIRAAIRSDGPDEFTGWIQPVTDQAVFDAPFSGERAVLASCAIQEPRRRPARGYARTWTEVGRESIVRAVVVEDDGERVKVEAAGATVETGQEQPELAVEAGESLPDAVRLRLSAITDAIDDLAAILPHSDGARPRRYLEGRVTPGESVRVAGVRPSGRLPRRRDVDAVFTAAGDGQPIRIERVEEAAPAGTQLRTGLVSLLGALLALVVLLAVAYIQFVA